MEQDQKKSSRLQALLTLERALTTFGAGIVRARAMPALYRHLSVTAPGAMSCSDLLRTAVVVASSAFDLLNHQAFRAAVIHKVEQGSNTLSVTVPAHVLHQPIEDALLIIDGEVARSIAHRSFLQPDKISELFTPILPSFWCSVARHGARSESDIKDRLRLIGGLRNRIVHESDINPDLAGISEWPIYVSDVEDAITFYHEVGQQIVTALKVACSSTVR